MNAQEFAEQYHEDGEVFGDNCSLVYDGEEIVNHKTVYHSQVYRIGEGDEAEYFEATFSRDNSGYWSDGERYDPEFRKVRPIHEVVTVTKWVDA